MSTHVMRRILFRLKHQHLSMWFARAILFCLILFQCNHRSLNTFESETSERKNILFHKYICSWFILSSGFCSSHPFLASSEEAAKKPDREANKGNKKAQLKILFHYVWFLISRTWRTDLSSYLFNSLIFLNNQQLHYPVTSPSF